MTNILNNLGMIRRAGGLTFGDKVKTLLKLGKMKMVLVSNDLSIKESMKLKKLSLEHDVRFIRLYYNSQEISSFIGMNNVKVLGIKNVDFVKLIEKKYKI